MILMRDLDLKYGRKIILKKSAFSLGILFPETFIY